MNLSYFAVLILVLAFSAYVITKWLEYRKVAVNAPGYAKTTGIYFLLFAFIALTGILSLSDKLFNTLLNAVLTKVGLPVLELGQSSEFKWMLFAAFFGLVIAVVMLLKEGKGKAVVYNNKVSDNVVDGDVNITNITHPPIGYKGVLLITLIVTVAIFFIVKNQQNTSTDTKLNKYFIAELQRKNKEIDDLKEQLKNSHSEEEKLHISNKIKRLKSDLDSYKEVKGIFKSQGSDKALAYLETIDFDNTLKLAQQHAKALLIKARFYRLRNQHQKAEKAFSQSLKLQRGFDNTISYAIYLSNQNKFPESIQQLKLLKNENPQLSNEEKATLIGNLANAYQRNNQLKDAERAYDEALNIYRDLTKENPSAYQNYVATTLNNLANLHASANSLKDAERAYDKALNIYRDLAKEYPSAYQSDVAMTLNNLANLYTSANRLKDAERAYDEALGIYRGLAKENPSAYQNDVAMTLNNLGLLYASDNRLKDAERAYDEALAIYRDLAKENPSAYQPYVATTLNNLAVLYDSDNRLKDAERAYDEALAIRRDLAKENHSAYQNDVATTLNNLAILYRSANRLKDAERAYDEALNIYRDLAKENPSAYGIDLANTLVMGVYLLNQPTENLNEAKAVLLKFKGIPRAEGLLAIIKELEGK